MAEWFKATVLKTVEVNSLREFESHSLRQRDIDTFDVFLFLRSPLRERKSPHGLGTMLLEESRDGVHGGATCEDVVAQQDMLGHVDAGQDRKHVIHLPHLSLLAGRPRLWCRLMRTIGELFDG